MENGQRAFVCDVSNTSLDIDSDGGIDWDDVDEVEIEDAPYRDAFGTDTFYRIPTTVTREMAQPYVIGDTLVEMKKPADELQKAAWSLDNSPITLDHPEPRGTAVSSREQIHGFVREPEFDVDEAVQRANTYVPTDDSQVIDYIEDGGDNVSPGFHKEYEIVEDDDVDAYQTDIVYDHVALTDSGRCSREHGCGLTADSMHGHVISFDPNVEETEDVETDQPSGIYVADDEWFAISPDEHPDDSTNHADNAKFPVGTCSDVEDAWHFANRERGDIDVSFDTLRARIQRAAEAQNCDVSLETDSQTMTDCDCGKDTMIEIDSLSLDAVAEKHDGVAEALEERDELKTEVDSLEEDLDEKDEQIEATKATVDDLKEDLSEYEDEEKQVLVDDITDLTEVWDEEDLEELELDTLEDRLELAEDMATDVKDVTDSGSTSESEGDETSQSDYEYGNSYDTSNVA